MIILFPVFSATSCQHLDHCLILALIQCLMTQWWLVHCSRIIQTRVQSREMFIVKMLRLEFVVSATSATPASWTVVSSVSWPVPTIVITSDHWYWDRVQGSCLGQQHLGQCLARVQASTDILLVPRVLNTLLPPSLLLLTLLLSFFVDFLAIIRTGTVAPTSGTGSPGEKQGTDIGQDGAR